MNIRDLNYFHQLIKTRNFSQTAKKFNISQPAVTLAIKRIEVEFNSKLFIRNRSHQALQVTPSGYQLDEHVKQILTELDLAQKELKRISSEKILFGLPPIIGTYFFPAVTPLLLQAGLMNSLETVEAGSKDVLELLKKGSLDLALIGSMNQLIDPQIKKQTFKKANFKIIVSPSNLLAKKPKIAFQDLADQPFIALKEGFVHANAFKQMCHRNGFRPKIVYQTDDVHILKAMVKEKIGIAFLTELAVSPSDGLVELELVDKNQPQFLISAAYRKNCLLNSKQKKLIKILLATDWPKR